MYVLILTGQASKENWGALEHHFEREIEKRPPAGLQQACLLQSEDDPSQWQILAIWKTKSALKENEANDLADSFTELLCDGGTVPDRLTYHTICRYERV
jgi:hypothetical protein